MLINRRPQDVCVPRRSTGQKGSVRLDYDEEVGLSLRELRDYYGIGNAKDLVRFLILQEHRRLFGKEEDQAKENKG